MSPYDMNCLILNSPSPFAFIHCTCLGGGGGGVSVHSKGARNSVVQLPVLGLRLDTMIMHLIVFHPRSVMAYHYCMAR